jgi:hypothetical protein
MAPDHKTRDLRWIVCSSCVIVISLLIQFYITNCGLLLTYDSREYLAAAQSFSEQGVFLGRDGGPYVFWPPLFPLILSFFDDPAGAMVWINLVVSACIGVLIMRLASQHLNAFGLRIGFLMAWMWGVHQLLISVFLWSELFFLLLLLLFAEFVVRATASRAALAGAFVTGFLLCLERNAGLFIVPAASLWFLLKGGQKKSFTPALVILLSVAGGVWWNVTNMFGSVSTAVSELDYFSFVLDNIHITTDGLAQSILPFKIFSIPFAILIIVAPVVLIWPSRRLSDHFLLMALICCFYIAGMAILFELDPGDADRYAAVILPFILLTIFRVFENIFRKANNMIGTILLIGMLAWLAYPLARTAKNALQWHEVNCNESVLK